MIAVHVGVPKCKGRSIVATTLSMVISMTKGWFLVMCRFKYTI